MLKFTKGEKKKKKNQIKCPLRRRLKIARELASLILLGSELRECLCKSGPVDFA